MLNLRISHENDRKPNFGDMQTYSKMVVFFAQVALAIGVLTSSSGVRVRRFCGFVARGGCHTGCRWRCRLVSRGQGSQIQDRAVVTQGVVGGVIF